MRSNFVSLRRKKGAYPLTYAILLIAVIIGVVLIIQLWTTAQERAGHAIQIQSVDFEETRTKIYVQNVGKGTVTVDIVAIEGEEFAIGSTNCTIGNERTNTLEEARTAEITVNRAYAEKVHIKVVCRDGTSIEADWTP